MTDTHTPGSTKTAKRRSETLRDAVRTGLIRVVGEQRYSYAVEELDRMTDAVLVEVRRHHRNRTRELPFGIGEPQAQLLQLLAAGHDVAGIAERQKRPAAEVADDVRYLYELLGVRDLLGAVVAGYEHRILQPKPVTR